MATSAPRPTLFSSVIQKTGHARQHGQNASRPATRPSSRSRGHLPHSSSSAASPVTIEHQNRTGMIIMKTMISLYLAGQNEANASTMPTPNAATAATRETHESGQYRRDKAFETDEESRVIVNSGHRGDKNPGDRARSRGETETTSARKAPWAFRPAVRLAGSPPWRSAPSPECSREKDEERNHHKKSEAVDPEVLSAD